MPIVVVRGVQFNHDTSNFNADALNIRKNASETVNVPEWQRGKSGVPQDSPAAYSIRETKGNTLTIMASFLLAHPGEFKKLEIRAVDPAASAAWPAWLIWLYLLLLIIFRLPIPLNILGRVHERTVDFAPDGTSDFVPFELHNVLLWGIAFLGLKQSVVGKFDVTWRWQWRQPGGGPWTDFDVTRHRIYAVLQQPTDPWTQALNKSDQWPWTEALEHACSWAVGASDTEEAAKRVTAAINGNPKQNYTPVTMFTYGSFENYWLTKYLGELAGGKGFSLNCTDCADATATFANLLGCDLLEQRFFTINTRPFLKLSGNPSVHMDWVTYNWNYHEICFLSGTGLNQHVYDACLQLDMDNNDQDTVHVAKLPVRMRFSSGSPDDYWPRLATSGQPSLESFSRRRPVK